MTCKCGCGREVYAKGYALNCYHRWRRAGMPDVLPPAREKARPLCPTCGKRPVRAGGECAACYLRAWRREKGIVKNSLI